MLSSSQTLVLLNKTLETCSYRFQQEYPIQNGELYCNWTWDSVLCWPHTRAGTEALQRCPQIRGTDPTKFVSKRCSIDGRWEGKTPDDFSAPQGWTNYTSCYTPEMLHLMNMLYAGGSEEVARAKLNIAEKTRILEIVGFSISLAALLVSLIVFCHFRCLKNNRTKIHKNLFMAMVIQVVIRLTLYADQAITRTANNNENNSSFLQGIDNTPILCEGSYVLLEYARTAMFMWMFIEGLYLHNMITVSVFQQNFNYTVCTVIGWGAPIIMTAAWAATTALHYATSKCWWGYNLTYYFWILEGPRLAIIVLNFLFLLNIIRVLIVKLRQSQTSETEQVRKAVKAAVVLLPLLGITNLVNMADTPLDRSIWEFAIWSFGTHFLTSFQGFFVALIYCFLNGEVRTAITKSLYIYLSLRHRPSNRRRMSQMSKRYDIADTEQQPIEPDQHILELCCPSEKLPTDSNALVPETEI